MTRGIIVIDGSDGTGMTTLARDLVARTGAHYLHLTYRWPNKMFEYHTAAIHRAAKLAQTGLVIVDRWWMSELCYANAYRGGSRWPLMYRMLDRIALKHGLIYVVSFSENIREHLNAYEALKESRSEMYKDFAPVVVEYHKLWDKVKTWPHTIHYDYLKNDRAGFIDRLLAKLESWREAQDPMILDAGNYNVTGHISSANYLLVGDRVNPRKIVRPWWPFHDYADSSLHLAKSLERLGFQEHEFIYTNYMTSSKETRHLMHTYDLKLVALGHEVFNKVIDGFGGSGKAWKILKNPQQVVHPAFDRRFRRGATMVSELGEILHRLEAYS